MQGIFEQSYQRVEFIKEDPGCDFRGQQISKMLFLLILETYIIQ